MVGQNSKPIDTHECGACPQLVERVYRELIEAHIHLETAEYAALKGGATDL